MKKLGTDSHERSRLYLKLQKVEEELKQDWFLKLKKTGEEVPNSMGRPRNVPTKQFLEDNDRKQEEKSALEAARANAPKKSTQQMLKEHLEEEDQRDADKELEREKAYKRMEYWANNERE